MEVLDEKSDIVDLLLSEIEGVKDKLCQIKVKKHASVNTFFLNLIREIISVSNLINVQSKRLIIGAWLWDDLLSLDSVFVQNLNMNPPISSWQVQSHFNIETSSRVSKQHLLVSVDLVNKHLWIRIILSECVKDVSFAPKNSIVLSCDLISYSVLWTCLELDPFDLSFLKIFISHILKVAIAEFRVKTALILFDGVDRSQANWSNNSHILLHKSIRGEKKSGKRVSKVIVKTLLISDE